MTTCYYVIEVAQNLITPEQGPFASEGCEIQLKAPEKPNKWTPINILSQKIEAVCMGVIVLPFLNHFSLMPSVKVCGISVR